MFLGLGCLPERDLLKELQGTSIGQNSLRQDIMVRTSNIQMEKDRKEIVKGYM